MKRREMSQERLEKLLQALSPLSNGAQCDACADYGFNAVAVIRDPMGGECLCARCAIDYARDNGKADLELAVRWRRFFVENPTECAVCASAAQRNCSYCATPLCEEHRVYIPRTGCACRKCAALLEEEQRRRNGEIW